jgi:hypothetical protein
VDAQRRVCRGCNDVDPILLKHLVKDPPADLAKPFAEMFHMFPGVVVLQRFDEIALLGVSCEMSTKCFSGGGGYIRGGRHFSLFSSLNLMISDRLLTGASSKVERNRGMQIFVNSQTEVGEMLAVAAQRKGERGWCSQAIGIMACSPPTVKAEISLRVTGYFRGQPCFSSLAIAAS